MTAFQKIRTAIYKKILKRRLKTENHPHHSVLLRDAKRIGVLFDATDSSNFVAIKHMSDQWKKAGKRVDFLGFIDAKHTIDLINHPHINRSNLSFFYIPKGNEVDFFLNTPFDILLYAHNSFSPPLFYLSLFSKARMRVGPLLNEFPVAKEAFEFMINLGPDKPETQELLAIYSKYLKMMEPHG